MVDLMDGGFAIDRRAVASRANARHRICAFRLCTDDAGTILARTGHPDRGHEASSQAPAGLQRHGSATIALAGRRNNPTVHGLSLKMRRHLSARLAGRSHEVLLAIFFDHRGLQVGECVTTSFSPASVRFKPSQLVARGKLLKASSMVIAHNHPAGKAFPSEADLLSTRELAGHTAGQGICLAEHLIVGRDGIYSMRRARLLV